VLKNKGESKKMFDIINKILGRNHDKIKAKVEIYTGQTCPYCIRAKLLLWWKGVNFTEYKIDGDNEARKAMTERANGRKTVPQIFINNQHIGGCDDLYNLDAENKLDNLLFIS
jgi:glutaredoxin 3